ncbi:MAG TPA: nucleotide exchange factor GrpE [Anaeromyxobacter sp.]|nr:nucleotide exchange factor GrpE [Anaeromyxobacter sp.]
MSEERRDAPGGAGDVQVKVVDRRRFRADGEVADAEPLGGEGAGAGETDPGQRGAGERPAGSEPGGPPDERDRKIGAQAARIDELMRAYAALVEDNKAFRQRLEREKARVIEAERAGVAQALLEAADDLERALAAVGAADVPGKAGKDLVEGVRLSLAAIHKRIAELGAERMVLAGQPFDPRLAEAVDTVAVGDAAQDGFVIQEVRPGYRIGDRVLRPARVRVGRMARA